MVKTFEKWQGLYNKNYQTLSWLKCVKDGRDRSLVDLQCEVCKKYESKICSQKNFSKAWLEGSANHKTSSLIDHATSYQHEAAMVLFKKDMNVSGFSPADASPILHCLMNIDERTKQRLKRKFDVCYVMAREGMSFSKYSTLLELESRHGVDLGPAYGNDVSAKSFTHYIAENQRQKFQNATLMDGTTDSGHLEDELVVVQHCWRDTSTKEIKSSVRYVSVVNPSKADTDGLVTCLTEPMERLGIIDFLSKESVLDAKPILIGGGTDGASVNIGLHKSIKERFQSRLPWIFWSWCFAHRLELASKDALSSRLFKSVEEMLLRLYYLYEKSPKKTCELVAVVEDLKEAFELPLGGDVPIRSQGSRWITHKRRALQRVIDRYGAYINHLISLADESTGEDKPRLHGYLRNWSEFRILVGCAFYIEVLKPPSILSLVLQGTNIDTIFAIKQFLKTINALKVLVNQDPLQWPSVKQVLDQISDDCGEKTYQGATLQGYTDDVLQRCKQEVLSDLKKLSENMLNRLEWSDTKLLRALLVFVDTQSWMKKPPPASENEDNTFVLDDPSLVEVKDAIILYLWSPLRLMV